MSPPKLALSCPSLLTLPPLDTLGAFVVRFDSLSAGASLFKVDGLCFLLDRVFFVTVPIGPLAVWDPRDWKYGLYEDNASGNVLGGDGYAWASMVVGSGYVYPIVVNCV